MRTAEPVSSNTVKLGEHAPVRVDPLGLPTNTGFAGQPLLDCSSKSPAPS